MHVSAITPVTPARAADHAKVNNRAGIDDVSTLLM
jgi:hypothetical protein